MPDLISARDSRLLLIRIRATEGSAGPGSILSLEAEAILDYESIFPATRFQLDLAQLQASVTNPNNQYGQLLGAQLIFRSRHPAGDRGRRSARYAPHPTDARRTRPARERAVGATCFAYPSGRADCDPPRYAIFPICRGRFTAG